MSGPAAKRRGQPFWAIGGIMLCWIGARAALFELPSPPTAWQAETPEKVGGPAGSPRQNQPPASSNHGVLHPVWQSPIAPPVATLRTSALGIAPRPIPIGFPEIRNTPPLEARNTARRATGSNLPRMAAMGAKSLTPEVAAAPTPAATRVAPVVQRPARWGGDAWLAWRPGSQALGASGLIAPVYGGSQAGAVLRYDLDPGSPREPAAYFRGVRALETAQEGDLAAGLAIRPLTDVPVTAHAEARLSRRGTALALRPAAFLSGGVEAVRIAGRIAARGYGQAGYVGGRDATPFVDGSVIAEEPLWRDRDATLTAGVGVWGGAQRGAARLDLGPSASLRFRLGEGTARVSADYRLRIAGNADPAAGAALTLSAGF